MTKPGKSSWENCSPEAIAKVVSLNHRESRRAALTRIGLTSAGFFSVVASGVFWWAGRKPSRSEIRKNMIIPIRCGDVVKNLGCYHQCHLDDALTRRIAHHLELCCVCRETYRRKFRNATV